MGNFIMTYSIVEGFFGWWGDPDSLEKWSVCTVSRPVTLLPYLSRFPLPPCIPAVSFQRVLHSDFLGWGDLEFDVSIKVMSEIGTSHQVTTACTCSDICDCNWCLLGARALRDLRDWKMDLNFDSVPALGPASVQLREECKPTISGCGFPVNFWFCQNGSHTLKIFSRYLVTNYFFLCILIYNYLCWFLKVQAEFLCHIFHFILGFWKLLFFFMAYCVLQCVFLFILI